MKSARNVELRRAFSLTGLEERINCAAVTNVMDYDPNYDPINNPNSVPIKGSLRYEIDAAVKAGGGEITFDETVDLGGGAHFGGPVTGANTINLLYGQISITTDDILVNPIGNVSIMAPKFFDYSKEYVAIRHSGYVEVDGSDRSVFSIAAPLPDPTIVDKYHPHYGTSVTLGGLEITGGKILSALA